MSTTKQGEGAKRGFVSIDEIVKSYLMDFGAGMERYEQGKHWILEGYRSYNFDLDAVIKTVQLSLTAWKAAILPDDFIDFVMIGVEFDKQIRLFTNDRRISLYLPDNIPPNGDPATRIGSNTLPDTSDISRFFFYNYDGRGMDTGKLFGLSVKTNGVGEFRINKERREIQFNLSLTSTTPIYLEYISDGINPSEKTCVNIYAAKLLKLYGHWMRHTFAESSTMAEKQMAEKMYYQEYWTVQSRLNPLRAEDVMEVMRDSYKLVQSV